MKNERAVNYLCGEAASGCLQARVYANSFHRICLFSQKGKLCHHLLILVLFQFHKTFFNFSLHWKYM